LGAGEHEVRSALGGVTGFDVDRLELTSGADGEAVDGAPYGLPPVPSDDASVRVIESGPASLTVEVDADEPVWLVLGQSYSDGWRASHGLGAPTLVDGYANGWQLEPTSGPQRITLRFTPQRTVNIALLLSLAGALLCLAIIAFSWRSQASRAPNRHVNAPAPRWQAPWAPVGVRPGWSAIVAVAVAAGVVGGVLAHPFTGIGVAVATAAGLVLARGPGVLAGAAVTSLVLAAAFTIAKQVRNDYPPDFGWPDFFRPAHHLAWLALLLVAASVVSGAVRRRASPRQES
jgi:hypothetical protein